MPRLTIMPLGVTIDGQEGETVMEAAIASGLYWPTTCGGQGICASCTCQIEHGGDDLDAMGRSERRRLSEEFSEERVDRMRLRLACQARLRGDILVTKKGVKGRSGIEQ